MKRVITFCVVCECNIYFMRTIQEKTMFEIYAVTFTYSKSKLYIMVNSLDNVYLLYVY